MKKVFINGCFDILHIGHVRLFDYAKIFGDQLIVAIDSDKRVKELKGDSRPINNQNDRKEMLLSNKNIDYVFIFDSAEELEDLISDISPNVMVVGDEYKDKKVIGSEYAKKLKFFKKIHGYSTSSTIQNTITR